MKKIRNLLIISLILNCLFITSIFAITYYEKVDAIKDKSVSMYFNGHKLSLKDPNTGEQYYPLIYNNRTYIPIRVFLNVVGVNVDWDEDNNIAIFETKYNIKTGEKEPRLSNWYKEKYYDMFAEEDLTKEDKIETAYYTVDKTFFHIPIVNNIQVSNREQVIDGTEWKGQSKEYLREYIFISEPMIIKEKVDNGGHSLESFYEKLRVVLSEDGFSLISENIMTDGLELKFVKSDMNLFLIKNNDSITLKIIKGTLTER